MKYKVMIIKKVLSIKNKKHLKYLYGFICAAIENRA